MSGKLIVFEGPEGSGKTSQIKLLAKKLMEQSHNVFITREPGGANCPIAEKVRKLLKDPANKSMLPKTEFFLFLASRAQHVEQILRPALKLGMIVICDRFFGSTFAYQHFGRGLFNLEEAKTINSFATGNLIPNLTLLCDLPVEIGLQRISQGSNRQALETDRFDSEKIEFHKKVRQGFLTLAQTEPNWKTVNTNQEIEVIHQEIWQQVESLLK